MKILCVIPSRIGSTRLLRKPLQLIRGVPMIQLVYQQAIQCSLITKTIVATDNQEIAEVVRNCSGEVFLTDSNIETGTDRVALVAEHYPEMEVIINLQGDEPFVKPKMLEELVNPYLNGENPEMSTLAFALKPGEYLKPEIVKVVVDHKGYAIYFSRSPIPYLRKKELNFKYLPVYHHMGLYAFRRDFLRKYASLAQTPLELAESLEQLRALEHGYKIKVTKTEVAPSLEINSPEDLVAAQNFQN